MNDVNSVNISAAAALATLALVLIPHTAAAQACCINPGAYTLGRVAPWDRAVLAAELGYDYAYGSANQLGEYHALHDTQAQDVVLALGGGYRVLPVLQLQAELPLRLQYRNLPGLSAATTLRPGDAAGALRWLVLEDSSDAPAANPRGWSPLLELVAGVTLPTGRAPEDSREASGADITGSGSWLVSLGFDASKALGRRDVVALSAFYGFTPERTIDDAGGSHAFDPGDELNLRLGTVHFVDPFWNWGLFSTLRLSTAVSQDDQRIANSALRRVRLGLFATHLVSQPNWSLTASLAFDPPVSGLAQNIPFTSASLNLLLSRSFARR